MHKIILCFVCIIPEYGYCTHPENLGGIIDSWLLLVRRRDPGGRLNTLLLLYSSSMHTDMHTLSTAGVENLLTVV
jgi:hypothetical protein